MDAGIVWWYCWVNMCVVAWCMVFRNHIRLHWSFFWLVQMAPSRTILVILVHHGAACTSSGSINEISGHPGKSREGDQNKKCFQCNVLYVPCCLLLWQLGDSDGRCHVLLEDGSENEHPGRAESTLVSRGRRLEPEAYVVELYCIRPVTFLVKVIKKIWFAWVELNSTPWLSNLAILVNVGGYLRASH